MAIWEGIQLMTSRQIALGIGISMIFSLGLIACGGGDEQNTGPLQHARYDHTATLLQDGKVLLAGGLDMKGVGIGNGEVYTPSSDTWAITKMMI
jgi:hypothetical protein